MAAFSLPACAQAVISVRSGLVHYFEGPVSIDGQPLQPHLGKFANLAEGSELRTGKSGRAELLLTPGVFLRIGENSAVRMTANALSDTRVALLAGSAIVDSRDRGDSAPVTLLCNGWKVVQAEKGVYRVDFDPAQVVVTEGEAQASQGSAAAVKVAQGMELPLTATTATEEPAPAAHDALSEWEQGRAEAISADNAIAENIQDPASMPGIDLGSDGFTYFPMLPFPSVSAGLGADYGSLTADPYAVATGPVVQPGFYSVYLPGYTRRPLGLPLPAIGIGLGVGLTGLHRGVYAPTASPLPYRPYMPTTAPYPYRPYTPSVGLGRPAAPAARPATLAPRPAGVHPIHHR